MSFFLIFVSDFLYRPGRSVLSENVIWFSGLLSVTHWITKMERFPSHLKSRKFKTFFLVCELVMNVRIILEYFQEPLKMVY